MADKISRAVLLKVQCICELPGDFFLKAKILTQEWDMRFCISSHKHPDAARYWSIENKSLDNSALIIYDYKMNKL